MQKILGNKMKPEHGKRIKMVLESIKATLQKEYAYHTAYTILRKSGIRKIMPPHRARWITYVSEHTTMTIEEANRLYPKFFLESKFTGEEMVEYHVFMMDIISVHKNKEQEIR